MNAMILLLFIIAMMIYEVFNISYLYYAVFGLAFIVNIASYKKDKKILNLIMILLYSIIIPNNYLIYLSLLLIFIALFKVKQNTDQKRKNILIGLFLVYLAINIVFHPIMPTNLFFSFFYFLPLMICAFEFKKIKIGEEDKNRILDFCRKALILQLISVIFKFIVKFRIVTSAIDFDWVSGTFGEFQGNIFFFFCIFCFILFYSEFLKKKKDLFYMIIAGILAILTGSIAFIIIFGLLFLAWNLFQHKVKLQTKILAVFCLILFGIVFITVTPEWIKHYMVRLYQISDKSVFISKIKDYENVFITIPNNDVKFNMIGSGVGQYASRSALTCTGIYIDSYSKMFRPSISPYTQNYIYRKLVNVYQNHLGTMDTPFSQIISIKGELGIIGLIFLLIFFYYLWKNAPNYSKIYVLFFIASCLLENYLEFAKVVSLLYMIQFIMKNDKIEETSKGEY